jgi:hypothetical protein
VVVVTASVVDVGTAPVVDEGGTVVVAASVGPALRVLDAADAHPAAIAAAMTIAGSSTARRRRMTPHDTGRCQLRSVDTVTGWSDAAEIASRMPGSASTVPRWPVWRLTIEPICMPAFTRWSTAAAPGSW